MNPRSNGTDEFGVEADTWRLELLLGLWWKAWQLHKSLPRKGSGGEVEEVELKTSRYDSHRVHAGWLGTWHVFLAFSAWTRIPALFIVPTDEPRQHHQVSLSCTTALKLSPTTAVRFMAFTFYTTCFKALVFRTSCDAANVPEAT